MKILYIAKHRNGFNDDEGAIGYALEQLGHEVVRIEERHYTDAKKIDADFLLLHKFPRHKFNYLNKLSLPKVFWYFDLVNYPDTTLKWRNIDRLQWMTKAVKLVDLGFCTDGDWVDRDTTGKLVWLMQGADERVTGIYNPDNNYPPILFTGASNRVGRGRQEFIRKMDNKFDSDFNHVASGIYREELGRMISGSKVVVAPDTPVTDRYWSNRVYMALGFGAFMIHKYSKGLARHYEENKEIVFYRDFDELFSLIEAYQSEDCKRVARNGLSRTMREHTYQHRCETLVKIVREKLL